MRCRSSDANVKFVNLSSRREQGSCSSPPKYRNRLHTDHTHYSQSALQSTVALNRHTQPESSRFAIAVVGNLCFTSLPATRTFSSITGRKTPSSYKLRVGLPSRQRTCQHHHWNGEWSILLYKGKRVKWSDHVSRGRIGTSRCAVSFILPQ